MAAVHSGIIPQSCSKCQRDPALKEFWGCDKPSQTVVERLPDDSDNVFEYYSCPMLFISKSSNDFYQKYTMTKNGQIRPQEYDSEDAKYIDMVNYYESWLNRFKSKIDEAKGAG